MKHPLAIFLLFLPLASTSAHEAPSGWTYDMSCCHNLDCAPAPVGGIREVRGGYSVDIRPGQHPMLPATALRPARETIQHGDPRIRISGDQDFHACLTRGGHVLCICVPPGAS